MWQRKGGRHHPNFAGYAYGLATAIPVPQTHAIKPPADASHLVTSQRTLLDGLHKLHKPIIKGENVKCPWDMECNRPSPERNKTLHFLTVKDMRQEWWDLL